MKRLLLTLLLLSTALSAQTTYTQPFDSGHGFTPAQSGACDSAYTDQAADSTDGNPVNSVHSLCTGRNDSPTTTWSKELTWEAMGVTAGHEVTQVDGSFDHQRTTQTHAQIATVGPLQIQASGGASSCMAADVEAIFSYPDTTGTVLWANRDASGAIAVNTGSCQTSSTTVRVQFGINPRTGNNASASTQVNVDNLELVITHAAPATGPSRVFRPGMIKTSRLWQTTVRFGKNGIVSSETKPIGDE